VRPPIAEDHRPRPNPAQVAPESELVDEANRSPIGLEQVVVELLEPRAGLDLEARREAARKAFSLDDDHRFAPLRQSQRGRQAEGPGSQDGGGG
jgi:hypothetical protein